MHYIFLSFVHEIIHKCEAKVTIILIEGHPFVTFERIGNYYKCNLTTMSLEQYCHSKPEMSVGYAKMNQANDYQSNLDHQWAYQMPLKTRKSNKPFLKKSQFSIFLKQNRAIKSKKWYI